VAVLAVFIGIFVTDFLIHAVWLANTYKETATLWRTDVGGNSYVAWLWVGQFLTAATFVTLYAIGFALKACLRCAIAFGLFMGLFQQATTLITYAVQPFPGIIATKWFVTGAIQGVLMGLVAFAVYKPRTEPRTASEVKPETSIPAAV